MLRYDARPYDPLAANPPTIGGGRGSHFHMEEKSHGRSQGGGNIIGYKNDFDAAVAYLGENGGEYRGRPNPSMISALNDIAHDCMKAYSKKPGDRELVGWFVYGGIEDKREDGALTGREVDGMCFVGRDGRAVIGISANVLHEREYCRVGVGLHELAHLGGDDHDDSFVARLMALQYRYFENAERHGRGISPLSPSKMVSVRTAHHGKMWRDRHRR